MLYDGSDILLMGSLVSILLLVLIFAYAGPEKWIVTTIILLTPFQPVVTRFATANVLIAYVVFGAFLLRRRIQYLPGIALVLCVFLALFASLSQAPKETWTLHITYIIAIGSAFCVFYVVYNYAIRVRDPKVFIDLFLLLNWLVVLYCGLQLLQASGQLPFDIPLELEGNRGAEDPRLKGPFGAIGLTAEYLVISVFVTAYASLYSPTRKHRGGLAILATLNLLFLVATGNRGGFLILVFGGLLFLYMFRDRLSVKTSINIVLFGILALGLGSFVTIKYTQYDRLYERLGSTEFEGAMPDTRATTWKTSWKKIIEQPVLGHGPRLRLVKEGQESLDDHEQITYPHNLYMFLLYTVGVVGTIAYLLFFWSIARRTISNASWSSDDAYSDGLSKLGVLMVVLVAVDQLKIEFLRFATVDYLQFIFAFFAIFMAIGDSRRIDGDEMELNSR